MTVAQVHETAGEIEIDFHTVSELTAIGALADDVLGDLIRLRAGLLVGGESPALRDAERIFNRALTVEPLTGALWDANRFSEALRVMAETRAPIESEVATTGLREWIEGMASDLAAVISERADGVVVERLEREFAQLGASTLAASAGALRHRGYSSSWLTH